MAGATTREFDVADHLGSPEEIAAYLDAVLEDGEDGNPRLSTLSGVLEQLGMRLSVTPRAKSA